MSSPAQPITTFWRLAGMSYLQYVNRAATAVRGAVNEPLKSKLAQQEIFTYKAAKWEGGITAPKEEITALSMAGKM